MELYSLATFMSYCAICIICRNTECLILYNIIDFINFSVILSFHYFCDILKRTPNYIM